ncbi:hypothetical protein L615_011400000010 [Nocardioides sp. J9]|uniref:hypothetical protein n=1 Tax=Nocardioides sp. J9 TaxID=935844 RepID=UPI0011A16DE7|nr:hypothetical protein [Nocardioides sp. J9]TWH03566.1 hypothetical protein L615_011400000010 [Nocardioides sp. J9]
MGAEVRSTLKLRFTVVAAVTLVACNGGAPAADNVPGSTSPPSALASVLKRCLQVDLNPVGDGSPAMALKRASADTSVGLTCIYRGPGGLTITFHQYADDGEHRRGPLSDFAKEKAAQLEGVGDNAYMSAPFVFNDGTAPPYSTAMIAFDVQTSRWKGIASGDPEDLDLLHDPLVSLAKKVAKASGRFGPLRRSDIRIAPEARTLLEDIRPDALTEILDTPTAPPADLSLSGDMETGETSQRLSWSTDDRSVSVALIDGPDTPRAYIDHLLKVQASTGYPPLLEYEPAVGLGGGAMASRPSSQIPPPPVASFEYIFDRNGEIYSIGVSDSGRHRISESGSSQLRV